MFDDSSRPAPAKAAVKAIGGPALAILAVLLLASIAHAAIGDGALLQKTGAAGCISDSIGSDGTPGCQDGVALNNAQDVAVAPGGESVYVTSQGENAVAIFDRDATTGELTQKPGTAGCVSETGTTGACQDGKALQGADGVAVSADGKSVYVGSGFSHAVAIFDRNTVTGDLTQKTGTAGCISDDGTGGACQDGNALQGAENVTLSADGGSVYVTSNSLNVGQDGVAIFDRNTTTGALTQKAGTAGCLSDDGTSGACQDGVGLDAAGRLAVSADGKSVYVASNLDSAVDILDRNTTTGELSQQTGPQGGCISNDAFNNCKRGRALTGAQGVAVSPNGKSVYVVSAATGGGGSAVAIFDRGARRTLTVTVGGTGSGSVTSSPAGINCGATCSANFADSTEVTLNGMAGASSTFAGWTGCDAPSANSCTMSMDADKAVTATFNAVDSTPPSAPTELATTPAGPANNNAPLVQGNAEAGSTVRLFTNATCAGAAAISGTAAQFLTPGLTINVPDNSTTQISATATDAAGNPSGCSGSISYAENTPIVTPLPTVTPPAATPTSTSTATPKKCKKGQKLKKGKCVKKRK